VRDLAIAVLMEGDGMCRLFGLSAAPHRVRASFWLLEAPDSLVAQSHGNPDGTGLGYFDEEGRPVLDKEPLPAYADPVFTREAKRITSTTFVSHIRFATIGDRTVENTHPFAMDDRVFAHNGVIQELDRLEERVGAEMQLVHGDTDSERYFALITKEIRALGDVPAGIASAVRWIASTLPLYSLNFVFAARDELWAFRYPDSHRLYLLEREAGGRHGGRPLHHASSTLGVHVPRLAEHPAVVLASEPLDDSPDWRLLRPGELTHVSSHLTVTSSLVLDEPPAHLIQLGDPGHSFSR
jgi:predicted glutamine amidotransferase